MLIDVLVYLAIGLAFTIAFGYIIIMIMLGPIAAYEKIKNLYLVYYEIKDNNIMYDTLYKANGLKSFDIFKKNIKVYKSKSRGSVEVFFNPVTDVMKVFKEVKEVS